MVFFDFNLITDPPNDELVNEDTQLNQNWDKLDARLTQFAAAPNTIVNPPLGTEALAASNTIPVWNGTFWKVNEPAYSFWGAWTVLPLLAPVVEVSSALTPKYRINTNLRKVELAGAVRATNTSSPWSRTTVQITANAGGIPDANKPVHDKSMHYCACGIGTTSGQFAGARVDVESNAGNSVKISVNYQGDDVGGNFVSLDGVRWFY